MELPGGHPLRVPVEQEVVEAARELLQRQPLMRGGYELTGGELRAYLKLLAATRKLEDTIRGLT